MKQMMRVAAMGIAGLMALSAAAADAYIESSGAQAIDTGYYPNPNTKIEVDFQYTKLVHQSRVISTETTDTNYLTVSLYNSGQVDDAGNLSWAFKDGTGNWTGTGSFAQKTRTLFVIDSPNNYYTVVTNNWTGEKFWTRDFANINQTRTKTARFSLVLFAARTAHRDSSARTMPTCVSTRSRSGSRVGWSTTTSRGRAATTSASRT